MMPASVGKVGLPAKPMPVGVQRSWVQAGGVEISRLRRSVIGVLVGVVSLVSCVADDPVRSPGALDADVVLEASVVVSGLDRPTQLAIADDGAWYIAQLAGEENEMSGQVLRIDPSDPIGSRSVVLDGLDKPTGVAVFAGSLWVMERHRLVRASLDGAELTVVVDDMVSNGRSEGSLTVDGDRLLFDTSGRLSQRTEQPLDPTSSSGVLWSIDAGGEISPVASGFKHAYAQTRGLDGVLWTTEIADGEYDGRPAPDEIVAIIPGADHGWPRCVGDNIAVAEFGGSEEECAELQPSQVLFSVGATPTGLAFAPWEAGQLLVALWGTGEVVAVSVESAKAPSGPMVVFDGAERPQHLVAEGDRVLVVDHATGRILALQPG